MRSSMVRMRSPCFSAKRSRSGIRAMVPSSFMISQMTPAGVRSARRARSTEPSVCPVRTRTPPLRARSGNTWPGVTRSSGLASGLAATRMVWARSAALMPVVTPRRASMLTVNAVPRAGPLASGGLHHRQLEAFDLLLVEGHADEAPPVRGHEVDGLGRHELGGHGQVALVLAVLVVDEDDHLARADVRDGAGDAFGQLRIDRPHLGLNLDRRAQASSARGRPELEERAPARAPGPALLALMRRRGR